MLAFTTVHNLSPDYTGGGVSWKERELWSQTGTWECRPPYSWLSDLASPCHSLLHCFFSAQRHHSRVPRPIPGSGGMPDNVEQLLLGRVRERLICNSFSEPALVLNPGPGWSSMPPTSCKLGASFEPWLQSLLSRKTSS